MARTSLGRPEVLVTDVARDAGLTCADTTRDRGLGITLRLDPGGSPDVRSARLWASGGGVFLLGTSDGYGTADFPNTDAEVLETVQQLVAVTRELLLHHDEEGEEVRSRGRRRRYVYVVVDGETHRLWGPELRDPSRPRKRWSGLRR